MSRSFEDEVKYHLTLAGAPDYTAKGDAANFFKINAKRALPILEKLAAEGNKGAAEWIGTAKKHSEPDDDDDDSKGSFMASRPDLF